MQPNADGITRSGILNKDVSSVLNALSVEERLETTLDMQIIGSGDFSGTDDMEYKDELKKEPPEVIVYDLVGDEPTKSSTQLPSLGLYGYDAVYGGYPISDFTVYQVFTKYVSVSSRVIFSSGNPTIRAYVLKDKQKRQNVN